MRPPFPQIHITENFHVKFPGEVPCRVSDPVGKNKLKAIIIIVIIIRDMK